MSNAEAEERFKSHESENKPFRSGTWFPGRKARKWRRKFDAWVAGSGGSQRNDEKTFADKKGQPHRV